MEISERIKASKFQELCEKYSKDYSRYINLKRELEQSSRKIEDIQQKVHSNDNIENLLEEKQSLEQEKSRKEKLQDNIEEQLKKENKIASWRWGITSIVGVLCYFIGIFDMISSTNLFRIGLFSFAFLLASLTAYILGKTILKKHPRWCIVIMVVLFAIAFWKIIDWYGLRGTAIPIQGTTLEKVSNAGMCAVGISLFVFLWEVIVLVIKNKNNENIEKQGKWEYSKEKESKVIDEIEQIKQEIDSVTKKIEEKRYEDSLKKYENSLKIEIKQYEDSLNEQWKHIRLANKENPRPEEVQAKLVDNLYMVDWEYNSELPPPMTHIDKASEPMVFLYHWDDKSKESELLYNFILMMTGTIALFNCFKLIQIKGVDFALNFNMTIKKKFEQLAEVVEVENIKELFSELYRYKQGESGTIIEHNQKELQNTFSEEYKQYKQYKIIQFIIAEKGMPQCQNIWEKGWWQDLTSAQKYGYLPIFYVSEEALKNDKTEFMQNFKDYMKNYPIYEIKDDMYCEKKESIER